MKKNTLFIGLVLSCIILLSYGQNCCILNSIRVQGLGENRIRPNIATIYAYLTVDGTSASDALNTLNTQLDSLISSLMSSGVSEDDIATSSISAYPKYNYTDGVSVIIGETVYISLTVTIRGIDTDSSKIANVIDALGSIGVSSIYGLSYDTQDPNAGKNVARSYAWNDAVTKAKQYAKLAGRKLGKVIIIEQASSSYYPYYQSYGPGGPVSQSSGDSNAIIPIGTLLISVSVVATWQLL